MEHRELQSSGNHPFIRIRDELNSMLQRFFQEPLIGDSYVPSINVKEKQDRYVVEAELPGMDPKEIDIEIHDNHLVIKGERHKQKEEEGDRFHKVESQYGSFYRSLMIPGDVNVERITAESNKGMLFIYLPKAQQVKPAKKIMVKDHPDD